MFTIMMALPPTGSTQYDGKHWLSVQFLDTLPPQPKQSQANTTCTAHWILGLSVIKLYIVHCLHQGPSHTGNPKGIYGSNPGQMLPQYATVLPERHYQTYLMITNKWYNSYPGGYTLGALSGAVNQSADLPPPDQLAVPHGWDRGWHHLPFDTIA